MLNRPTLLWMNEYTAFAGMGYYAHGGAAGRSLANSATSEWGFDAVQRMTAVVQNAAGTSGDAFLSLTYNPASQIASRAVDNDSYAWTGHYAVNRTYTVNGLNQYTAAGSASLTYDANGNLASDGADTFSYDVENRLVSVSGAHNATLAYDPLGRLSQLNASGVTTTFLHDGGALVAEYEGAAMRRRYAHWVGSDVPLLSYAGTDLSQPSYLHADQQGSIVMVSGQSGNPTVNRYDEYGIPQSTNAGRFGYTGQAYLPELGMYYYRARIYSPTLGRFLQTDPIGYGDGMNFYAYVGNDPVNLIDPSGLEWRRHCTEISSVLRCGWHWVEEGIAALHSPQSEGGGNGGIGPGDGGAQGGEQLQCPPSPATDFLTGEDAIVGAAQAGRAQQRTAGDQNERSFRIFQRSTGSYGYSGFIVGTPDSVPIAVNATGSGHLHNAVGGDRLSSTADLGRLQLGYQGDMETIGGALRGLEARGIDVSNTLTALGAANGDVLVWRGRNLRGPGERIGSDQCR